MPVVFKVLSQPPDWNKVCYESDKTKLSEYLF